MATLDILTIKNEIPITVQRVSEEDPERYAGKMVGYVHMRYLVLGELEGVELELGELLLIRMLSEGEAVAYQATVKKVNSDPKLYMTSFPEKVESVSLRKAERIKVFFPAEVRKESLSTVKMFDAMVLDISEGGCAFSCKAAIREKDTLLLAFCLPGQDHLLRLTGHILSINARNEVFSHRLQFDDGRENAASRAAIAEWIGQVSVYALE